MAIVDGSLQLGYKDSAWFTTNATLVLLVGQIVYLEQTGTYKIGDGVTQLSSLSFLGGSSLGYIPEDVVNKSTSVNTDQSSNTKYTSVKAVFDWATSLFVKKGTLTTNTIQKATASDTIGNSNITDNGTKVNINSKTSINGSFNAISNDGNSSIVVEDGDVYSQWTNGTIVSCQNNDANESSLNFYNGSIGFTAFIKTKLSSNDIFHSVKNMFSSPLHEFDNIVKLTGLTPSQIVETDASKNLVSVAKGTAHNKNFGTTAGTVLEGNRITQTITNGDTTHAPSGDVVFDALLMKADKQNGLVSGGAITVGTYGGTGTNNDIRVAAATWYISPSNYTTSGNTDFLDITLAAAGLQRYVGFYGDNTNTITMVNGAETEYAVYPATPVGKALIGYVLVTYSAAASTPDLSGYMLISSKATLGDVLSSINDSLYVTPLSLRNFARRLACKFIPTNAPNTTNVEILHSYLVNGIANVAGRTLDLFISTRQTSDANTKTWRVYFNSTNDLTGAVLVATLIVTTNGAYFPFQRFFHLVNNTTIFPDSSSWGSHASAFSNNTSASPTNITVPNMNNNFYILITCQKQLSTNATAMDRTTLDLK